MNTWLAHMHTSAMKTALFSPFLYNVCVFCVMKKVHDYFHLYVFGSISSRNLPLHPHFENLLVKDAVTKMVKIPGFRPRNH